MFCFSLASLFPLRCLPVKNLMITVVIVVVIVATAIVSLSLAVELMTIHTYCLHLKKPKMSHARIVVSHGHAFVMMNPTPNLTYAPIAGLIPANAPPTNAPIAVPTHAYVIMGMMVAAGMGTKGRITAMTIAG
jgi:hypothetical protein